MKLKTIASTLPFAHLLGLPSSMAAKAADDDEKEKDKELAEEDEQREDESDEEYARRMEEKDDEKAEEEGEEKGDGEDEEEDEKGKARKAKADEEDDMDSAKKAERARCARIIAHGIQNHCVRQAGVFAFDTDMTAVQAIAALNAAALDKKPSGLASRMANVTVPVVGADGGKSGPDTSDPQAAAKATAELIIRAGQKRRGEIQ